MKPLSIIASFAIVFFLGYIANANATTVVSGCGTYGTWGETYILNSDLTGLGADGGYYWWCMRFIGYNQIIDCQNHKIQGAGGFYGSDWAGVRLSAFNQTIKNCDVSGFMYGISMSWAGGSGVGTHWTIDNVTVHDISDFAIDAGQPYSSGSPHDGVIKNSNIYRSQVGFGDAGMIEIGATSNILIDNVWVHDSFLDGIGVSNTQNFTLRNSQIEASPEYGLVVIGSGSTGNVYNNWFNETTPVYVRYYGQPNVILNTNPQTGPNIVGGLQIGGNYYTNANQNGYSDTCTNGDGDSFCDVAFVSDSQYPSQGMIDAYPLSKSSGCMASKDCSIYSGNSWMDFFGATMCGLYNFLTCIGPPYMFIIFASIGALLIISAFGLLAYVVSKRN